MYSQFKIFRVVTLPLIIWVIILLNFVRSSFWSDLKGDKVNHLLMFQHELSPDSEEPECFLCWFITAPARWNAMWIKVNCDLVVWAGVTIIRFLAYLLPLQFLISHDWQLKGGGEASSLGGLGGVNNLSWTVTVPVPRTSLAFAAWYCQIANHVYSTSASIYGDIFILRALISK